MSERDGADPANGAESDDDGLTLIRDRDEREQLLVEIPRETLNLVRDRAEQHGKYQWEVVVEAIHAAEGGSQLTTNPQIEREIEIQRRKKWNAYQRVQNELSKYHDHQERIEAFERRKERLEQQAETRTEVLDNVLDDMAEHGQHADIGVGRVPELANEWFDGNQPAALDALKDRADEINAEIPDEQFSARDPVQDAAFGSVTGSGRDADANDKSKLKSLSGDTPAADGETGGEH